MRIAMPARFATLFVLGLLLTPAAPQSALAGSRAEIEAEVDAALVRFYEEVPAAKDLARKAKGILIFPRVVKAGFGVGGEYGEGALRVGGKSVGYYNTAAASIGLQIGVQGRAEVLMFMTQDALDRFRASDGWEVGVDGSVTVVKTGVAGEIDTTTFSDPVIGFIFGEQGLILLAAQHGLGTRAVVAGQPQPRGRQDHQDRQVVDGALVLTSSVRPRGGACRGAASSGRRALIPVARVLRVLAIGPGVGPVS